MSVVNLIRRALDRLFRAKTPPMKLGPGPHFAAELVAAFNVERRLADVPGLGRLALDPRLCQAAQEVAERLARGLDFNPDRLAGSLRGRHDYPCVAAKALTATGLDTTPQVAREWKGRLSGRATILDPAMHDAGFGFATALDGVTRYWCGVFADPAGD